MVGRAGFQPRRKADPHPPLRGHRSPLGRWAGGEGNGRSARLKAHPSAVVNTFSATCLHPPVRGFFASALLRFANNHQFSSDAQSEQALSRAWETCSAEERGV